MKSAIIELTKPKPPEPDPRIIKMNGNEHLAWGIARKVVRPCPKL